MGAGWRGQLGQFASSRQMPHSDFKVLGVFCFSFFFVPPPPPPFFFYIYFLSPCDSDEEGSSF